MPQDRPIGYGIIDDNGAAQPTTPAYPREIPEASNGFTEQVLRHTRYNHSGQRHGHWARYFDQQVPSHLLFLGTLSTRLTLNSLAYDTGAGLSGEVADDSAYVVGGSVVNLSVDELESWGLDKYTFSATRDTHVYARTPTLLDAPLRLEAVTIATPPSPAAGELYLGTMTTDASDRTAWTASTEDAVSAQRVRSNVRTEWEGQAVMRGPVQWIAPNGSRRIHKQQNLSAGAKGYTLRDTITYQAVTGSDQHLIVVPSTQVPTDGTLIARVEVSAVDQADAANYGFASTIGYYTSISGTLAQVGSNVIDSLFSGALTSVFIDRSGNNITCRATVPGGVTSNIEIAFTVAVAIR